MLTAPVSSAIANMFATMTSNSLDHSLFSASGINHCPVDGTISLYSFVDADNSLNFYSYVKDITVRHKYVKDAGRRAVVDWEMEFRDPAAPHVQGPRLDAIWLVGVDERGLIDLIDSYWDVAAFKARLQENHPHLVSLFFRATQ